MRCLFKGKLEENGVVLALGSLQSGEMSGGF